MRLAFLRSPRRRVVGVAASVLVVATTVPLVVGDAAAQAVPVSLPDQPTCSIEGPDAGTFGGATVVGADEPFRVVLDTTFSEGAVYQDVFDDAGGARQISTYLELRVEDRPGVHIDTATLAEFTIDGSAQAVTVGTQPQPGTYVVHTAPAPDDPADTLVRVYFPGDSDALATNVNGHGDVSVVMPAGEARYRLALNGSAEDTLALGEVTEVAACRVAYATDSESRATDTTDAAIVRGEPIVSTSKTADPAVAQDGDEIVFTLVAETATDTLAGTPGTTAYDTTMSDLVPPGLTPIDAAGTPVPDGGTVESGGVWTAADRTVRWPLGTVAPGVREERTLRVRLDGPLAPSTTVANLATTEAFSAPADRSGRVRYESSGIAEVVVAPDDLTITKAAARTSLAVGEELDYTLTVVVPPDEGPYHDLVVYDVLPDGLDLVTQTAMTCSGCTTMPTATTLTPTDLAAGTARLGWAVDRLDPSPGLRTLVFHYSVRLAPTHHDGRRIALGEAFENVASLGWNLSDRAGDAVPTTRVAVGRDEQREDDLTVTYERPTLEIDIDVDPAGGDTNPWIVDSNGLQHAVRVTNPSTAVASDVHIELDPDNWFPTVQPVGTPFDTPPTTVANGEWIIPEILPGQTVTLRFLGRPSFGVTTNQQLRSTADIVTYSDGGGIVTFTDGPSDVLVVPIQVPGFDVDVEILGPADPMNTTVTGEPITFRITLTNTDQVDHRSAAAVPGQSGIHTCMTNSDQVDYRSAEPRPGQSGIHTAMTNTRNTPIEALERAFPLRVLRYRLRRGSGGAGWSAGGEGIERDLQVLEDATVSLITERRVSQPWGLAGGEPGAVGENWLLPAGDEARAERLPDKCTIQLRAGDVLRMLTPGGGGWGEPIRST